MLTLPVFHNVLLLSGKIEGHGILKNLTGMSLKVPGLLAARDVECVVNVHLKAITSKTDHFVSLGKYNSFNFDSEL